MGAFKEGLRDGVATYGAIFMTLIGVIVLAALLTGLQIWLFFCWIAGAKQDTYNALKKGHVVLSFALFTDTYQHWREKINQFFNF